MGQQAQTGNQMQQASASTNQTIQPYYVGGGKTADVYTNMVSGEQAATNNAAQVMNLAVGAEAGNVGRFAEESRAPHFDAMMQKYLDVSNREAGNQASKIGETLGSRGALYSSANLQQQADLRQKQTQDIGLQAQTFQSDLEKMRQSAETVRQQGWQGAMGAYNQAQATRTQGMGNVMGAQAGIAQAEYGAREAAMARAYQDFIRQSEVPPFVSSGIQWGSGVPRGGAYAA